MIENARGYLSSWLRNYWIKPWLPRQDRNPVPTGRNLDMWVASETGPPGSPEWFWKIVDDPVFDQECAEVIRLRLDRETCDVIRTWAEIGRKLGITRDTASRRFANGMDIIRRMLEDEDT